MSVDTIVEIFQDILDVEEGSINPDTTPADIDEWDSMANGMHIGSHSYDHLWHEKLDNEMQEANIKLSTEYLLNLGCKKEYLSMCYPFGSFNSYTLECVKSYGYRFGVSTVSAVANLGKDNPLTLPRKDTNDFPKN